MCSSLAQDERRGHVIPCLHDSRGGQRDGVDEAQLKQFINVKEELTVNAESNLILRGSRIVIPTTLQQRAVDIAHQGHQGIVKTKKLLREKVWMVKGAIQTCIACQFNGPENHPQPLKMTPLLPGP